MKTGINLKLLPEPLDRVRAHRQHHSTLTARALPHTDEGALLHALGGGRVLRAPANPTPINKNKPLQQQHSS